MPGSAQSKQNYLQAIELLNQAVADDPQYFLAYCQLAYAHDSLYFFGLDHTAERRTQAEDAVQAALGLRPEAAGSHLARAEHLYRGYLNYDGALAEIDGTRRTLANDPRAFELTGYIRESQGQHSEAVHNLQRALELDPQNLVILRQLALSFGRERRYAEEIATLDAQSAKLLGNIKALL
jgi:tetratricopeptide (TPR) repeat protein